MSKKDLQLKHLKSSRSGKPDEMQDLLFNN